MFALIAALTLYMALAPVQPALSVGDYRPHFSRQVHLTLAADRPDTIRQVPIKKDANRLGIETSAKAAIIIDWQTAQPLLEENADTPQPIASLTKLVTALVVLERGPEWGKMLTMLPADQQIGDIPLLLPGEAFTIEDLFNLSLIASSNDAAAALARSTGLPADKFVEEMNAMAAAIGMDGASFVEPTGLDPLNLATARDVALLVRKALSAPDIKKTVAKRSYDFTAPNGDRRHVDSTDQLLDSFLSRAPYVFLGGKTGYLDEAGYCFGAAAENAGGDKVVAVVLGAENKDDRFREVKRLIYWAFDAYEWPARVPN